MGRKNVILAGHCRAQSGSMRSDGHAAGQGSPPMPRAPHRSRSAASGMRHPRSDTTTATPSNREPHGGRWMNRERERHSARAAACGRADERRWPTRQARPPSAAGNTTRRVGACLRDAMAKREQRGQHRDPEPCSVDHAADRDDAPKTTQPAITGKRKRPAPTRSRATNTAIASS